METGALLAYGRGIVRALKAISAETGQSFSISTKPGRFEIQKTVYLLKRLGFASAQRYEYNIYLNGPYSPGLAEVYYAYEDDGLNGVQASNELTPEMYATIAEAREGSHEFLEGLTTVIDGVTREGSPQHAIGWARTIKPHIGQSVWKEVQAFLGRHPELTRRT
jgi:hypothetical protein